MTLEVIRDAVPVHWKKDHTCLLLSPTNPELAEQLYDSHIVQSVYYAGLDEATVRRAADTTGQRPHLRTFTGDPSAQAGLPFEHFQFNTIVDHVRPACRYVFRYLNHASCHSSTRVVASSVAGCRFLRFHMSKVAPYMSKVCWREIRTGRNPIAGATSPAGHVGCLLVPSGWSWQGRRVAEECMAGAPAQWGLHLCQPCTASRPSAARTLPTSHTQRSLGRVAGVTSPRCACDSSHLLVSTHCTEDVTVGTCRCSLTLQRMCWHSHSVPHSPGRSFSPSHWTRSVLASSQKAWERSTSCMCSGEDLSSVPRRSGLLRLLDWLECTWIAGLVGMYSVYLRTGSAPLACIQQESKGAGPLDVCFCLVSKGEVSRAITSNSSTQHGACSASVKSASPS